MLILFLCVACRSQNIDIENTENSIFWVPTFLYEEAVVCILHVDAAVRTHRSRSCEMEATHLLQLHVYKQQCV
jgi:hypothetical protein